ncbi:MAG: hypothetical protein LBG60_04990 [Bifidobacteriaceae bacterium]|jgi:hypothetical protein|nr:hypothetical protein [Bifidobacteriaceae bacterium]
MPTSLTRAQLRVLADALYAVYAVDLQPRVTAEDIEMVRAAPLEDLLVAAGRAGRPEYAVRAVRRDLADGDLPAWIARAELELGLA